MNWFTNEILCYLMQFLVCTEVSNLICLKIALVKYRTGINSDSICEVKFRICSSINQLGTISGMDTCQCGPADGGNMTIRSRVWLVCTTILTIIHYTVLYNTIL